MPLRVTGPGGDAIVDVSGNQGLPTPAGYLDAAGAFHRRCDHEEGACTELYALETVERMIAAGRSIAEARAAYPGALEGDPYLNPDNNWR
jgi:hypothetical protein